MRSPAAKSPQVSPSESCNADEHTGHAWQRDWSAFVHQVAALMDSDDDDEALTRYFRKKPIRWVGTLYYGSLHDGLPGIQFMMPVVQDPRKDGKYIKTRFVFAFFRHPESDQWRDIEKGATVQFETEIGPREAPFYGVQCGDLGSVFVWKA